MNGHCACCMTSSDKLIKSHIISKFLWDSLCNNSENKLLLNYGNFKVSTRDLAVPLVCQDCDTKIMGAEGEDPFSSIFKSLFENNENEKEVAAASKLTKGKEYQRYMFAVATLFRCLTILWNELEETQREIYFPIWEGLRNYILSGKGSKSNWSKDTKLGQAYTIYWRLRDNADLLPEGLYMDEEDIANGNLTFPYLNHHVGMPNVCSKNDVFIVHFYQFHLFLIQNQASELNNDCLT